jgi:hypothetical protein
LSGSRLRRAEEERADALSPASDLNKSRERSEHQPQRQLWDEVGGSIARLREQLTKDDLLSRIDEVLGQVVERDPAKTLDSSPKTRCE